MADQIEGIRQEIKDNFIKNIMEKHPTPKNVFLENLNNHLAGLITDRRNSPFFMIKLNWELNAKIKLMKSIIKVYTHRNKQP